MKRIKMYTKSGGRRFVVGGFALVVALSFTGCTKYSDLRTSLGIHGCALGYCIEPEVDVPVAPPPATQIVQVPAPAPISAAPNYDPLPQLNGNATIKTLEK